MKDRRNRVPPRLPTREECEALTKSVLGKLTTAKTGQVSMSKQLYAANEFAQGEPHVVTTADTDSVGLTVELNGGRRASTQTYQMDDDHLTMLVKEGEAAAEQHLAPGEFEAFLPAEPTPPVMPKTLFDSVTDAMQPDRRAAVLDKLRDAADKANLLTSGTMWFNTDASAVRNTNARFIHQSSTYADLSVTMRTKDGKGSGWGWAGAEDWNRIDVDATIHRAVDLAQRSANPVAVEPGRYTVILEPWATAEFIAKFFDFFSARMADNGYGPFAKDPIGTNKLGLQMADSRFSLVSDPWDPDNPRGLLARNANLHKRTVWFEHGVLKNLEYDPLYARDKHREATFNLYAGRVSFDGASTSLEEMIKTTKRGIWVNRLHNIMTVNDRTLLLSGMTRDGTFLIENGKVTKAIKNFRFTESPFFVLNKVEAFDRPVRASWQVVAPRVKVRDFDFTSLTDAV